MSNIFITSDNHFGHEAIISYCNRPFTNVNEMNECLIEKWNSVVGPKDIVYCLGDFGMGKRETLFKDVFNKLNGSQKFLIRGNHDSKAICQLPWAWVRDTYMLKISNTQMYFLSHYPHRAWPQSYYSAKHLFGHCHGTVKPWGQSCDIGIDCWDYKPVHIDEIESFLNMLPRINPEYSASFMPKGEIWKSGRHFDYSYQDFFVGDGTAIAPVENEEQSS